MAFNEATELFRRYREMYDCAKTGSIGVGGDIDKLGAFLEGIASDPEKLKDFEGILNASGTSVKAAKAKFKALRTIQAATEQVYPPTPLEPDIQITPA